MAAFIAKKVGGKITKGVFESHLAAFEPIDPLYEETVDARGKKKRVRRQLPPGLTPRDTKILQKVKKRAHYLDKGVSLCGFRVGWTFFIGLIPLLGDIIDILLNHNLVVKKAKQAELPDWLVHQMILNNTVSAGFGAIPFLGDIILGIWKANSRNAHLLEEFLALRGQQTPYIDPNYRPQQYQPQHPPAASSSSHPYPQQQQNQAPPPPPHLPPRPDGSHAPLQPGQQEPKKKGSWFDGLPGAGGTKKEGAGSGMV
ncbi:hypothetical protein BDY24DRAFT_388048 [Mrakia frigida]|uniref:DUF4112 domain-containing protein n=1 Tax=Mrakia frigida TaxID=29902 RepID=UPI003FCC249E